MYPLVFNFIAEVAFPLNVQEISSFITVKTKCTAWYIVLLIKNYGGYYIYNFYAMKLVEPNSRVSYVLGKKDLPRR